MQMVSYPVLILLLAVLVQCINAHFMQLEIYIRLDKMHKISFKLIQSQTSVK